MTTDYEMLVDFWRDVVAPRDGRGWIVATAYDGDFSLRDGYAWGLVQDALHGRPDVRFLYVNPAIAADPAPPAGRDVVLIGRPKLYAQSELAPLAARLAVLARGRFRDHPNGMPGDSVSYDKHVFTRRDLETWLERYRRSDLDYAVLQIATDTVAGERRVLVSIAGITALATLCLAILLSSRKHCETIAGELATLLPWTPELRPREYLEVCIRIEVPSEAVLRNFLNVRQMTYRVEAVFVAGATEPRVRAEQARLRLVPGPSQGGRVLADDADAIDLGRSRFQVLRWLVEHPEATRTEDLFEPLGLAPAPGDVAARRSASVRVAKTVHDLNALFGALPAFRDRSAIESKKQRYVLNARARVVGADG
jgi:hypothetical protein